MAENFKIFTTEELKQIGEFRFVSADPTRCYRTIDLPIDVRHSYEEINIARQQVVHEKLSTKESLIGYPTDQNFHSWLDSLGLEIEFQRLFTNAPGYNYTRHVDRIDLNDQSTVLNFPFEDAGSQYSWYNLKETGSVVKKLNTNGAPVYYFDPEHCEQILKLEIHHKPNQPILVNTGYIHSVNVGNTNRYCFSYFLRKKGQTQTLQWDDAVKIFAPFIAQS